MSIKKYPTISVAMITYGHQNFIEQAINGVLMQNYEGKIELIIGNDKSPDETNIIIKRIMKTHPNGSCIKYTSHVKNLGIMPNFVWSFKEATGKYIAICEGDDYWTDPSKLQKQVDFLENNEDCSMCFHSVNISNEFKKTLYPEVIAENRFYSAEELLLTKIAHTASYVFRNNIIDTSLFLDKSIFAGDVLLALQLADQGKVYGMSDYMGVYRMHLGGVTSTAPLKNGIFHQERLVKQFVFFREKIKSLPKRASAIKIVDHCMTIVKYYVKKKSPKALYYLGLAVYYRPDLITKGLKKIVKWKN